eukprot:5173609-Pyramimonas_sp.AAC.1
MQLLHMKQEAGSVQVDTKLAQSAHCDTSLTRIALHNEHPPTAQETRFAQHAPAHFGTPFARIAHWKELHLWHQWAASHGVPPPFSAHASYGTFPTGRFTCGVSALCQAH